MNSHLPHRPDGPLGPELRGPLYSDSTAPIGPGMIAGFRADLTSDAPVAGEPGVASLRDLGFPFEDVDVLADLFLGAPTSSTPPPATIRPADSEAPATLARIVPSRIAPARDSSGQASPGTRGGPSVIVEAKSRPLPEAPTPSVQEGPSSRPDSSTCTVDALIVGHLPVLGSAWVLQFAKHTAQVCHTPVALVRSSGGEITIDLCLEGGVAPPRTGPMPGLEQAVGFLRSMGVRWMIRVDDTPDRAGFAPFSECLAGATRVCVLTGSDEAAIVGCYRVMKTLMHEVPVRALHLAVMGSPAERASDAARRLEHAAGRFLSAEVSSEVCSPRIGPGSSISIYRGRSSAPLNTVVAQLLLHPSEATPVASEAAVDSSTAATAPLLTTDLGSLPLRSPLGSDDAAPADAEVHAAIALEQTDPVIESSPRVSATRPARVEPAARVAPARPVETVPAPTAASEASPLRSRPLSRHLASLSSLSTTCPHCPNVELAVDPAGRLHLVAHSGASSDALAQLASVSSWALAHESLLRRAFPQLREMSAVQHLLTDAPRTVRALLDTAVRVHLLTAPPGTTADADGWLCVDLN